MEKKDNQKEDMILKEFFDSIELQEPSEDFTKSTMNRVMREWSSQPQKAENEKNIRGMVLYGVAISAALLLALYFDRGLQSLELLSAFKNLTYSFSRPIVDSLDFIPGITYIILFGGAVLYGIDKLVRSKTEVHT